MSTKKSQQSVESATHARKFSYSPAIFIALMAIKNIQLRILGKMSHGKPLNAHQYIIAYYAESRLKIRE